MAEENFNINIDMSLFNCDICFETLQYPLSGECDHPFCSHCLLRCMQENNNSCPRCREEIFQVKPASFARRLLSNSFKNCKFACNFKTEMSNTAALEEHENQYR